uniref:Uncharacterized protein n=1 Tax=Vespula pensylvanica TaxID=30213 RepID=A0A834KUU4_VESPE|nr:hypothetical protein H0235_013218 [Vespula pensylvanica]
MDEDAITHVRLNYLSIDESNPGEPKEKPIANTYSGIDTFTEYLRHGEHPPANEGPEDRRKGWKVPLSVSDTTRRVGSNVLEKVEEGARCLTMQRPEGNRDYHVDLMHGQDGKRHGRGDMKIKK